VTIQYLRLATRWPARAPIPSHGDRHELDKVGLLTVLVLVNIAFVIGWVWAARRYRFARAPGPADIGSES